MHVTSLSSIHPWYFDVTAHQGTAVEDEGPRVVRSLGLAFVLADVAQSVLEVSPDSVAVPISEVACRSYGLLMHLASRVLDCSSDWMQARFTAWESGTYLDGPIRTRQVTLMLTTLPGYFQGRLAIAALQRSFPGHYLTAVTAPPATMYKSPFKLARPPPSAPYPTLARLRGGTGNADSGSEDDDYYAANLRPNACTNTSITVPPFPVWTRLPPPY